MPNIVSWAYYVLNVYLCMWVGGWVGKKVREYVSDCVGKRVSEKVNK